nr:MAG TPA: hypothetical protein [Bacteriophage sp.]
MLYSGKTYCIIFGAVEQDGKFVRLLFFILKQQFKEKRNKNGEEKKEIPEATE